ncbi:MAG: hypothetical protein J6U23_09735 [Clostridiales bacterium]|nr:hypothetical protein [Clostridiales bacterium]
MEFTYSNDCFLPYESFDYIFSEREMPEFGKIDSPYSRPLNTWKFFLARSENEIPMGFDTPDFDDSDWNLINVPSTWQTEGYGLPQNLLYDFPEILENDKESRDSSINNKNYYNSTSAEEDEIGIYRTTTVFSEEDLERAIYFEASGITGSFEVYVNGKLVTSSHSILTNKRLLLSPVAQVGINTIVVIINRYDRDKNGKIIKELANFGFSGIFRPVSLTFESLLEMSNLHIKCSSIPNTYVDQLALDEKGTERKNVAKISRGDYMIFMDVKITNHTNYMMPFSVRTSILEARGDYDPYNLPFVKLNIEKQMEGTVDANSSEVFKSQAVAVHVAQWSDATPVQYDVVLELLDSEGRTICAKKRRFGFRTAEVILDKLNINDRRIPLMLTRYYEFDPQNGIAIPISRMRQDIVLMKRCGINGIIVSSFPANDMLLNLCDQYGIYVFAMSDSRYMFDYVEAHMNHPSIVCWGFPNYNYDYNRCKTIKNQCEVVDDARPWYCEKDQKGDISDLPSFPSEAGNVYGPWEDICLDRAYIFGKNKTGVNLFKTIPGRTNFDDDDADYKWIHQADLEGGKTRVGSSIGQGIVDSERKPHPIYFDIKKQCEMVNIFPDPNNPTTLTMRNIHPFAFTDEMILEWKLILGGNVLMFGNGLVSEIEPYGTRTLKFNLDVEKYLKDGWADGNEKFITMYNEALSHELIFDISLKLAKDSFYSKEGYEVAFFQEVLTDEVASPIKTGKTVGSLNAFTVKRLLDDSGLPFLPSESEQPLSSEENNEASESSEEKNEIITDLSVDEGESSATEIMQEEELDDQRIDVIALPKGVIVGKDDIKIAFDRKTGSVNHISVGGFDFLNGGFLPSFYRCPSNIDRTDKSFILAKTIFSRENDYEGIQDSLQFAGCNYSVTDDVFTLISRYKSFAMKGEVIICYEMHNNELKITLHFTPKYDMVRYGLRVPINQNDVICKWYGRGPGESYYDRKNATRFGIFQAKANEIYHPYARPAENSSHTDTSTLVLTNKLGDEIRVVREGNNKFEFTVLPYSPEQMNEFLHQEQLMNNEYCELFLDFCSKEIERTRTNTSSLPLKKNVTYKESFILKFKEGEHDL